MLLTKDIINSNIPVNSKIKQLESKTRYYNKDRKGRYMDEKVYIANFFMNELNLIKELRKEAIYMIKHEFKDLKVLSKQLTKEQIITLIIFLVMRKYNSYIKINKYSIFKRLNIKS